MAGSTPSATSIESLVSKRRLGEENPPPRHKMSVETGRGGQEGRKQIWEHYCSKRQVACMLSLVKTVQYRAMLVRSRREGYTGWSQDNI